MNISGKIAKINIIGGKFGGNLQNLQFQSKKEKRQNLSG